VVEPPRLLLWLYAKISVKRIDARLVLAERGVALAELSGQPLWQWAPRAAGVRVSSW
jgi:hypothetical protein